MKRPPQRRADLNWEQLQISPHNLDMLASDFTESEIKGAINQIPSDKAPGPDGFTGFFFKECWDIVKGDIMNVANAFHRLCTSNLAILSTTNVVLIPKKDWAESILNFRPISLIHSFAKIIAKVLPMRLVPHMNSLISKSQSAFVKKRRIHDDFMSV
jgi:hypothetical protein